MIQGATWRSLSAFDLYGVERTCGLTGPHHVLSWPSDQMTWRDTAYGTTCVVHRGLRAMASRGRGEALVMAWLRR